MGVLIKNGRKYGGGNNSKTISYEEYKNLSDEEKHNGIIYYIPDYPNIKPVPESNIVDSLDSTDTDKALSANMGRELKENIDNIIVDSLDSTDTDKALSANMGRELKENIAFSQVITEVTMLKNEGDSFVINEIDSRVKFVVVNQFAQSSYSLLDSVVIPVDSFKSLDYLYFNIANSDYKTVLNMKNKTANELGSSAKYYGIRISIIGY